MDSSTPLAVAFYFLLYSYSPVLVAIKPELPLEEIEHDFATKNQPYATNIGCIGVYHICCHEPLGAGPSGPGPPKIK